MDSSPPSPWWQGADPGNEPGLLSCAGAGEAPAWHARAGLQRAWARTHVRPCMCTVHGAEAGLQWRFAQHQPDPLPHAAMAGASLAQLAQRALVSIVLRVAALYGLAPLGIARDSSDTDVDRAVRRVLRRAHPDKGGDTAHAQELNAAADSWKQSQSQHGGRAQADAAGRARGHRGAHGLPGTTVAARPEARPSGHTARRGFRIQYTAVMLTYNGIRGIRHWRGPLSHRPGRPCSQRPRLAGVPAAGSTARCLAAPCEATTPQ